jgi:tight adherence protein C
MGNKTMMNSTVMAWVASGLLSLGVALFALEGANIKPLVAPRGGRRGQMRSRARNEGGFRAVEKLLLYAGGVVRDLLQLVRSAPFGRSGLGKWLKRSEEWQRRQLIWAGEPLGLHSFEVFALSAFLFGIGFAVASNAGEGGRVWAIPVAVVCAALPNIRLQSLAHERFAEMSRRLPAVIDLIALAMNAGSDFPGAIRRVTAGQRGVIADELGYLVHSLDLGISRSTALLEKKGASVTEALAQQARSSRQRRSIRAEEAAARAGTLLLMPMMLLMCCVMILLVAPLMLSGAGI